MLETLGAMLGVVLGTMALIGAAVRWILLPYLRDTLFTPLREAHRQVTENKHSNPSPTLLDRLDDLEQLVEAVGLNQQAVLRLQLKLDRHVGESSQDRARLWLMVESLIHEQRGKRGKHDKHRDTGGTT